MYGRAKQTRSVSAFRPRTALGWLLVFQFLSCAFLGTAFGLLCALTTVCSTGFFLSTNNVTLFNSEVITVSDAGYAWLCVMFFVAGVGYVVGFGIIEVAYMPIYTRKVSVAEIFEFPQAVGVRCGKAMVYVQFLLAVLIMLVYSVFFFLGALGQWPFAFSMGGGIFAALAGGGVQLFLLEQRVDHSDEKSSVATNKSYEDLV